MPAAIALDVYCTRNARLIRIQTSYIALYGGTVVPPGCTIDICDTILLANKYVCGQFLLEPEITCMHAGYFYHINKVREDAITCIGNSNVPLTTDMVYTFLLDGCGCMECYFVQHD